MNREEFVYRYNEIFQGVPWYGTSLLESLDKVPLNFWNKKPYEGARSISEYVGHLVNWRKFVIEKLKSNKSFNIEMNTKEDWGDEVIIENKEAIDRFLGELKDTQYQISEMVLSKNEEWCGQNVPGKTYTNAYMLEGILQHDIYHLGQLNLINSQLKRLK